MDASFAILGPIEIRIQGKLVELGGHKQRAILAMLLIDANRVVPLDRIIDWLWREEPPRTATGSLQAYISHLRRALEPERRHGERPRVLVTKPPGYVLMTPPDRLDSWRFEQSVETAREALAAGVPRTARSELDEALALWRGPALAEFAAEPFAIPEATRLEALHWSAREMTIEAELALGDARGAIAQAEVLLKAEPLRERVWSLYMLALYRAGRQADALQAYRRAEYTLREELGVDPSPDLRYMHELVLRQSDSLDWTPNSPDEITVRRPAPRDEPSEEPEQDELGEDAFVGRHHHLDVVRRAVDDVAGGASRLLLIVGEAGIGKTRLAREAIRYAEATGLSTAWGSCHEGDAAPAFWPWTQIVRQLVGTDDEASRPDDRTLTDVFPAVTREAQADQVAELSQMPSRTPLYDRVVQVLVDHARRRPLALVFDDLQWADVPSLQLLELVAEQVATHASPILLMSIYREGGFRDDDSIISTVDGLMHAGGVYFRLTGLRDDEVGEMIARKTRRSPDASVVAAIRERTGGNPFFITELLRLTSSEGGFPAEPERLAAKVPPGVSSVVRRRLTRLPDAAVPILTAAAVYGRVFDFDVLANMAGIDQEALLNVLDAGVVTSLLEEDPGVDGRFRFVHDLVRETLLERLTTPRRALIHARVAEGLVAVGADRDPSRSQQVASHFWFGASVLGAERALPFVVAGADAALSLFAYEDEAEHLRRALTLLHRIREAPDSEAREFSLQTRLGTVLARLEGWASVEAREAFERSVELSEALDPERRLTSMWGYVLFLNVRAEFDRARELAVRLLEHGRAYGDPLWLSVAHETIGIVDWHTGQLTAAVENFGRAIAYGDEVRGERFSTGLQNTRVASRCHLAATLLEFGRVAEAERLIAEALKIAGDDPYSRAFTTLFDAWAGPYTGDHARARRRGEDLVALASARGFRVWESFGKVFRGWGRGDPDEIRSAIDELDEAGVRMVRTIFNALLADAALQAARPTEASQAIARAFAVMEQSGERGFESVLLAVRKKL